MLIPLLGDLPSIATSTPMPAAVALVAQSSRVDEKIFCSGVPIRQDLVLTAAHCLQQFQKFWPSSALKIKTQQAEPNTFNVRMWFIHPQFQNTLGRQSRDVDIALLVLEPGTHWNGRANSDTPTNSSRDPSGLWMKGYSPVRLKTISTQETLNSQDSWNRLNYVRELQPEGKVRLSAYQLQSAPCAGDSGAPLWSFEKKSRELRAIVVQGNCSGGEANAVPIASIADWIQGTVKWISELRPTLQELWKTFPQRLFAVDHN